MSAITILQLHESGILIAAFLVCVSALIFTILQSRTDRYQNRVFINSLVLIMADAVLEITKIYALPYCTQSRTAAIVVMATQYAYLLTHTAFGAIFYYYMLYATGAISRHRTYNEKMRPVYLLVLALAELLILTNPISHAVYYFDASYQPQRAWGMYLVDGVIVLYFTLVAVTLVTSWHALTRRRRNMLTYSFVIMLAGILLELLYPAARCELIAEALALLGAMVTIENEDDRMDMPTMVYNRLAMRTDLNSFLRQKYTFYVICVRITNADVLQRLLGTADSDAVVSLVAEYLCTVHPRYYIYRTTPTSFMLAVPGDQGEDAARALAERVDERFTQSFRFQDTELLLQALVLYARAPEDFATADDILLMGDGPIPMSESGRGAAIYPMGDEENTEEGRHGSRRGRVISGHGLDFLMRRAEVESALHRGLGERNFEIYYQPIYRTAGMSIYSAEALLRLKDSRLGNITPDEFIPVAEQNGMIDALGDYVLEEVCTFLSSGIPSEMGLECISINLSVLQCMQPDFIERALEITGKYSVEPRRISFELTESVASSDYEILGGVISQMKSHGFLFSLDRYGVGYSNIRSVFALDYDLVKIDKTILWDADREGNGRIILENSIRMMKEMDLGIIAEGVETQAQIEMLEALGVDYLQGYYFSQPVSKSELLGILRITELARMEEQRAHAISEAKSSFLADMSHEIRTPINAVLGMDEMILRESKDPQILEYAQNIEGAGRTLLSLINDILDFSKIESGSMEIDESEYGLSSVINDVVNMVQIKAAQKRLDFNIHVDPHLPERLYGDEMRNRQIMVNILNNAVKYTKEGSVTLDVSGERRGKDRIMLRIQISDTGIGIRNEDLGKLFRKFQRLDEEQNRKIEGTGLGLAITYNLLQIMHGEIDVRSTYGEGSTFTVLLPQRVISSEEIGDFRKKYRMGAAAREEYHESFRAPLATILVVDDMAVNHIVVTELLKLTEIQIDTAMSGAECLEKVQAKHYDAILLDFRMPEMDGIETLRIMRTLPTNGNKDTPVIALTADAVAGARERFLNAGFDDYMVKPVDGRKLEELLRRTLPPEKVTLVGTRGDNGETLTLSAAVRDEGQPDWMTQLGDLDVATGIKNCGSEDGYRNVLQIYYDNIRKKADEIEAHYQAQDWTNYTILVHALKSSSRIIGASELSAQAADLEAAGNALQLDKIHEGTAQLLHRYRAYAEVMAPLFGSADGDAADGDKEDESLPEISEAMYADALSTMKDFANLYDYDNILYVIDSLKEYRLGQARRDAVLKLRALVEDLAWEEVIERLKEM